MRFVKYWLPVMVWTAAILVASGDLFSTEHSGELLAALLGRDAPLLHLSLRKVSHLVAYAILGALAFRAASADLPRPVLVALWIALLVATADEWHQSMVPTRSGSPWDVGLDLVGAGVGVMMLRRGLSSRA